MTRAAIINRWRKWFPHPAVIDSQRRRVLARKARPHVHDKAADPIFIERGLV